MKTILAVDDSPSIRMMVSFTITNAGYECIEAADGLAALDIASSRAVDMVVTDQNMPHMDGFTLIGKLRSMPNYAQTPIIVLTTEASDDMKARGRAARATGWMVKPFHPDKLLEIVRRLLG